MSKRKGLKISHLLKGAGFLLLWAAFAVHVFAQITVDVQNQTRREALREIEQASNYRFFHSESLPGLNESITIQLTDVDIDTAIRQVFAGTNVGYEKRDGNVVALVVQQPPAAPQPPAPAPQPAAAANTITVSGTVVDNFGDPLPGATVQVYGIPTIGTATNLDGIFTLANVPAGGSLVFNFTGMESQTIPVNNRAVINVVLYDDVEQLEELVVTAFGVRQRRETMAGSVQSITPDQLRVPSSSLSSGFAGRLSGVIAVQRTGRPGQDGADFFIRGISTISGHTQPLIILDGVEISAADLNALDPEIIYSFSVLRDATATAMYGSRGANGVMIITTRTGGNMERPIMNFRLETSMVTPGRLPQLVDGVTYMELFNQAVSNFGSRMPYSQARIDGTRAGLNPYVFPNVNWYDEIFKGHTFNQNANFNIRGGGNRANYFSSVTVTRDTGLLRNRSSEFFSFDNNLELMRVNMQNNVNAYITPHTVFSLRLNVNLATLSGPYRDPNYIFNDIMNLNPVDFPVRFPDDPERPFPLWGGLELPPLSPFNPVANLVSGYRSRFTSTIISSIQVVHQFQQVPGLSLTGLASFRNETASTMHRWARPNLFRLISWDPNNVDDFVIGIAHGAEQPPTLGTGGFAEGNRSFYFQTNINYDRRFGAHGINAMLLYNQDQRSENVVFDLMTALPRRRQSIAGRFTYDFDRRYVIETNFGFNGSENFAPGHRFGFFPSVAVAYNVSLEEWFEPLTPVVSHLRLRASYGLVGNDRMGAHRFIFMEQLHLTGSPAFTTGINQGTHHSGPVFSRFGNPYLTWETGRKLNAGIDFTLFRDWRVSADVFREDRSDIFQQRTNQTTIPAFLGTANTTIFANTAAVRNHGFDASLDYGRQINRDWTVEFRGTFTFARNRITQFDEIADQMFPNLEHVGRRLNVHQGFIAEGLFIDWAQIHSGPQQQVGGGMAALAPGDIRFREMPNRYGEFSGIIDDNSRVWMGHPRYPEIVYGFGPSIRFRNLDFSFLMQGVANTSLMMQNMHPFGTNLNRNVLQWIADDHWSPDNQNIHAAFPRLTQNHHYSNRTNSTFWLRDGSFLKLRNAEIGYNIGNARLYLSGHNLLSFASFRLWDPEQGGGNPLRYPTTRVFNLGFQMTIN